MLRISFGDEPKKGGAGPEEVQNSTGPQGPGTGQVPKTQNDLRPLLAQKWGWKVRPPITLTETGQVCIREKKRKGDCVCVSIDDGTERNIQQSYKSWWHMFELNLNVLFLFLISNSVHRHHDFISILYLIITNTKICSRITTQARTIEQSRQHVDIYILTYKCFLYTFSIIFQ